MKTCQNPKTEKFLQNALKNFNPVFWGVWITLTAYEIIYLQVVKQIDPGSNPKYAILCNLGLAAYSFLWSYASGKGKKVVRHYLPTLMLPIALCIMEFINFKSVLRFAFFAQLYHYTLLGIVWFLFWSLLLENRFIPDKARTVLAFVQSILETLVLWLSLSFMINALLNGGIDNDAVVAICQTTPREAWHYFWGINHGVILVCSMAANLALFCFLILKARNNTLPFLRTDLRRTLFFQTELAFLICFLWAVGWQANMYAYFKPSAWKTALGYKDYHDNIRRYQNLVRKRKILIEQYFAEHESVANDMNGIFVLIIGESANRRYMGCYGAEHDTTPFQSTLKKSENAVFFNRPYACHAQTTKVVPMMLTVYNQYIPPGQLSDAERSLSLLDLARESGFQLYWFSNQEKTNSTNSIITSIASVADQCFFMQDLGTKTNYDFELLSAMRNTEFAEKSLVIIHLNGSHYPYGLTFPPDFDFPDGLSTYERSIYYNDFVIQNIMEFFQSQNTMLISYVSDHSDAVSIGKGHDPRPDKFCREMIEIPMWVWVSQEYRDQYPLIFEKLRNASGKVITNDLMFNLLQDMMSIRFLPEMEDYSPLSANYILDRENVKPKTLDGLQEIPSP